MQEVSPVLKNAPLVMVGVPSPKWVKLWGPDQDVEVGKITSPYELDEFIPDPDNPNLDRSGLVVPYCYDVSSGGRTLACRNASRMIEFMALFQAEGGEIPSMTLQLWGFDWTPTPKARQATEGGEEPGLPFIGPKAHSVATGLSWPMHRDASPTGDSFTITGLNGSSANDQTRVTSGSLGLVFGDADGTDWVPSLRHKFEPDGHWCVFPWVVELTNASNAILLGRAV